MPFLIDYNAKNCYDLLHLDAVAVEERRTNWTALFSYDRLPC